MFFGKKRYNGNIRADEIAAHYKLFIDHVPLLVCIISETGVFLSWNAYAQKILGYSSGEIVHHKTLADISIDAGLAGDILRQAGLKHVFTAPLDVRHKNGSLVSVQLVLAPYKNSAGNIVSFYGFAENIGYQKESEYERRTYEETLQGVVDNVGIGVLLINPQMEIVLMNKQMKEWYPHVSLGMKASCYTMLHDRGDVQPCLHCPTEKTFQDGLVHETIQEILRDGIVVHQRILSSPIKDISGRVISVVEIIEDVTTQRKKALEEEKLFAEADSAKRELEKTNAELLAAKVQVEEISRGLEEKVSQRTQELRDIQEATINILEDLQESKDVIELDKLKMESMIQSMSEGVILLEEGVETIVMNPQARRMLDCAPDQAVSSRHIQEKLKQHNLLDAWNGCRSQHHPVAKEISIGTLQKTVLRVEMNPVYNSAHALTGVVIVVHDITREREIDRMKSEFISTVSHELRTPLAITKEGISLVLDRISGQINEQQQKILTKANDNIDRLSRIINNLLDISKIEAGRVELKKELVDIAELARAVLTAFESRFKEKNLSVSFEADSGGVWIFVDADKMVQVFTNLLNNALKFTNQGGVTVKIHSMPDSVECSVADTGIGISEEDMPRVFQKFQQFGRIPGGGEKGTGLGLSIVRGIIELHNGKVKVVSSLGKGTTFICRLPTYTSDEILFEYITNGIAAATVKYTAMSLVLISIAGVDQLVAQESQERGVNVLHEIKEILHDALRGGGDVIVKDRGELALVLVGCDKLNVLRVEGRLSHALEDYLARHNLSDQLSFHFSSVTYPEDGATEMELLTKIRTE
ncbi:MAG TPA: ATP-binding protein [Candidatus Omnitrophota bacterium]|nr:ATP-binding protein [Candidatus Omnitrophota bacterium]